MFTGIIRSAGRLVGTARSGAALELSFDAGHLAASGWRVGDSVCVSGVCLTIARVQGGLFAASVSPETLARTTLGQLAPGDPVNLEPALAAGDPLGGHYVTGHVDGVARVDSIEEDAGSLCLAIAAPPELAPYFAPRGSIALDGVSLTINDAADHRFKVTIIPHTRSTTTLGGVGAGHSLNLEVDILARYLARLINAEWK